MGAASANYEGWLNTDLLVLDALNPLYLHMGLDTDAFQTLLRGGAVWPLGGGEKILLL